MTQETKIDPLLSQKKLAELGIRYSRQWLWELERNGQFPKRVQIGPRASGWHQSEIAAWLAQRPRAELKAPPAEKPARKTGATAAEAHGVAA